MSDRLREIAEREAAATPCEWEHGYYKNAHTIFWGRGNGTVPIATVYEAASKGTGSDNADFIAHARADIPWLLANTSRALAYIDRILATNPNGAELMFLGRIKAILTGTDDGQSVREGSDE